MIGVFTRTMGRVGRVARESGRAARTSKGAGRGTTAAEQPREGTRGRGAAPTNTNGSRQHRAASSLRRAPGYSAPNSGRLQQEWSRSASAANEAH